jgi:hypothetical protein
MRTLDEQMLDDLHKANAENKLLRELLDSLRTALKKLDGYPSLFMQEARTALEGK